MIYPLWLRHDIRDVACFVATCSLAANFLPKSTWVDSQMKRWPSLSGPVHDFYLWLVDMVAFCSLNWRVELPSMDFQWLGFARSAKHLMRNWRQDRIDRRT
jgi:hypothetical protein